MGNTNFSGLQYEFIYGEWPRATTELVENVFELQLNAPQSTPDGIDDIVGTVVSLPGAFGPDDTPGPVAMTVRGVGAGAAVSFASIALDGEITAREIAGFIPEVTVAAAASQAVSQYTTMRSTSQKLVRLY
ncbi:MAG: hypothetical protein AAF689_05480 [Pseudomonadota bacterium]